MKMTIEIESQKYSVDLKSGKSIAIGLDFDGPQPNHFGVDRANVKAVEVGEFVGDTTRGGSCNVDHLFLIPHCNGTHTESVSHIIDDMLPVGELAADAWYVARLITVEPIEARDTNESYRPELDHHDRVITASALSKHPIDDAHALVIRTLPNDPVKRSVAYGTDLHPAFLTVEAMENIVAAGIDHLLLDVPSVDKMYDEGLLTNHHLFWNVSEGTHENSSTVYKHKTISEMVYVPDEIVDGRYLLTIQIPNFVSDAAPSRPLLFTLVE